MGPVISEGARRTILQYIETGKQEGRLLPVDVRRPAEGYFVPPTVIADVDSKARIFQEEIFGPVLAVTKARDFDHAMELANDSQYGLTGAIFSNVPEHVERARRQFFVGNLYVNRKCTGAMVGAHPFGGFNMSGTDSKGGRAGLYAAVPAGEVHRGTGGLTRRILFLEHLRAPGSVARVNPTRGRVYRPAAGGPAGRRSAGGAPAPLRSNKTTAHT